MEDKPKLLPPSMRERERYIVFEVISKGDFSYDELSRSIWFTTLAFLGELGASSCGIKLIRNLWDERTKRGVIRCFHNKIEEIRSALTMIRKIGNEDVIVHVLGVTGTIKSAKRKFLGHYYLNDFGERDEG